MPGWHDKGQLREHFVWVASEAIADEAEALEKSMPSVSNEKKKKEKET